MPRPSANQLLASQPAHRVSIAIQHALSSFLSVNWVTPRICYLSSVKWISVNQSELIGFWLGRGVILRVGGAVRWPGLIAFRWALAVGIARWGAILLVGATFAKFWFARFCLLVTVATGTLAAAPSVYSIKPQHSSSIPPRKSPPPLHHSNQSKLLQALCMECSSHSTGWLRLAQM